MKLKKAISKLPTGLSFAIAAIVANVLIYGALFLVEKPVTFSYASNNCIQYPVLFPDVHTIQQPSGFKVQVKDTLKVGNLSLLSTSLCFSPSSAPHEGTDKVSIAPYGGFLARTTFAMRIPAPSKVLAQQEAFSRPVSVTKELAIALDSKDTIFSYALAAGDKTTDCVVKETSVMCDMKKLDLHQGQTYDLTLNRLFNGQKLDSPIEKQTVQTLSATRLADSSIKAGEVVFYKPKTIDLIFDKEIVTQDVKLYRRGGDRKDGVAFTAKQNGKGVTIVLAEDLPRQAEYDLVVNSIEAGDGSGLEEAVTLPFIVSGGPKVTGVSVGKTGVAVGSTVVVTFDQPLSEMQNTAKAIKLGGGASFAGKQGNQLLVTLKDTPKCGDFSIEVTDDLMSNYEVSGASAWSFTARTRCYTVGTIGYSSGGRPISAYYFGNGPRTVLYTGAIHGNEVGTKYLMDRWIQDLEANAKSIPDDKSVVVVPQINPDGVAAGTRVNKRNVDLNRNFAVSDWQKDITDVNNRPFPGGGGATPMSEPETRAIAALASQLRPIFIMSFHSIGGVLAANQAGDSISRASMYSQLSGYQNVTGKSAETFDYSITGTADDWYAEALGIPSVLVELSSHTSAQFDRNQKGLWKMLTM